MDSDDDHYCLKCHKVVQGLDNYVGHRATCREPLEISFRTLDQTADRSGLPVDNPVTSSCEDIVHLNETEVQEIVDVFDYEFEQLVYDADSLLMSNDKDLCDTIISDRSATTLNIQLKAHYSSICDSCTYYPIRTSNYLLKHSFTSEHKASYSSPAWSSDLLRLELQIAYAFPFVCSVCSFYATKPSSFAWHLNSVEHKNQSALTITKCNKCGLLLKSISNVLEHYRKELNSIRDKFFYGNILCCSFDNSRTRSHSIDSTKPMLFNCCKCKQSFKTNFQLRQHSKKVHEERPTQPPSAPAPSSSDEQLERLRPQKNKPKDKLSQHIKVIKSSPPKRGAKAIESDLKFACNYPNCKRAFRRKCQLQVHSGSHNADKPFKCAQCSYATKYETKLKQHAKVHGKDGCLQCKLCDYKTKLRITLITHMLTHTGVKPHQCPHCDYNCTTNGNLRKHIINKHKLSLYPCKHCPLQTNKFSQFVQHLRTAHGDLYSEFAIKKITQKTVFDSITVIK